jgi:hypothetical protein
MCNGRGQDLDGHFSLQKGVESAIYLAHSACAEQAEYFVAVQLRACG